MPTSYLFRKASDPGNLHAYFRFYKHIIKTLPIPPHPDSHSHETPTCSTYGVSSSGKATPLTFSRCQNTVGKGFPSLSAQFWEQFLLHVPPFLSSSSTDALSLKSHLYCFGFHTSRLQIQTSVGAIWFYYA